MVVVVLADAEDVAAWQRDRCLQLDIGKRDRLAQFRQRLPLGRQAGQSVHAALGLATPQREGPELARGLVKDADAPFAIDAECTYLRSEEHTSELQSQMRSSYAVSSFKQKKKDNNQ